MEKLTIRSLRELDKLVAEKIFNWCDFWEDDGFLMGYSPEEASMGIDAERAEVWEYSSDIRAAWEIIEKLREANRYVQCTDLSLDSGEEWWSWHFHDHASTSGEYVSATASTAPIAICLAALKTVGIEVELSPSQPLGR